MPANNIINGGQNHQIMNTFRSNPIAINQSIPAFINPHQSINHSVNHNRIEFNHNQESGEPCFDMNHNQTLTTQNQTSTNTINQNHHHLSNPRPQRAPIPINITSFEPDSTSSSCVQNSQSTIPSTQPAQAIPASQSKKTSRSKQPTQRRVNKEASQADQSTREGDSTVATKSSKALLDHFLSASARLPDNLTLPDKLTVDQLFHKYNAVELRAMADQYSRNRSNGKGTMSKAKRKIIQEFYNSTEKLLAIMCIHLGISQDVAATEVGRCTYQRTLGCYDYFKKSQQVSDIYRENGGPLDPVAIEMVSSLWKGYSPEEKKMFGPKAESETLDNMEEEVDNYGVNPGEIPDNRPTQKGLVTLLRGSNDDFIRNIGLRTSGRNLERSRVKCEDFVSGFIKQANNMSRLHPVQFTITAVSTHLSKNCFQYMATTPGLWDWAEYDLNTSGGSTPSKMQAYVTGKTIAGLVPPKRSKAAVEVDKLKANLNEIIRKATNNPEASWPWSNCENRLEEHGFKLQYEPSDSLHRSWITHPNSGLTEEKARRINHDVLSNPISLIPIEGFVGKYKTGLKKKRKRSPNMEEDILGGD
ncbi:hypothetical protein DFH28DRAFT_906764 [Melampsora americana]|nr:hypothetical protein DFH28DRAFT_906764 [Melampsora americana]